MAELTTDGLDDLRPENWGSVVTAGLELILAAMAVLLPSLLACSVMPGDGWRSSRPSPTSPPLLKAGSPAGRILWPPTRGRDFDCWRGRRWLETSPDRIYLLWSPDEILRISGARILMGSSANLGLSFQAHQEISPPGRFIWVVFGSHLLSIFLTQYISLAVQVYLFNTSYFLFISNF